MPIRRQARTAAGPGAARHRGRRHRAGRRIPRATHPGAIAAGHAAAPRPEQLRSRLEGTAFARQFDRQTADRLASPAHRALGECALTAPHRATGECIPNVFAVVQSALVVRLCKRADQTPADVGIKRLRLDAQQPRRFRRTDVLRRRGGRCLAQKVAAGGGGAGVDWRIEIDLVCLRRLLFARR